MADHSASLDVLGLYRWAVQDPETHATVLRIMYDSVVGGRPGRAPTVLREDFAGTAAESVAWVALGPGRRAIAVDLDGPTLSWARARAERLLGERAGAVTFIKGDSLRVGPPEVEAADIVSVLNFSILYLRDEAMLRAYLSHARACLAEGGILVMNLLGGPGAVRIGTTTTRVSPQPRMLTESSRGVPDPFEYHWEVRSFDPETAALDCRIHFTLERGGDGGRRELRDAFCYQWRLWTLDELMSACREAGFGAGRGDSGVQFWRHTYDPSKGAAGVFLGAMPPDAVAPLEQWTGYIVAVA